MSVEQKLTDKNVVSTTTSTSTANSSSTKSNKKNQNNNNNKGSKKFIKKALKISKNKKHANITNVNNNKTTNENNSNSNNNITSNSSSSGNKNVEVANDEIIEELFDFNVIDSKELDNIKNEEEINKNNIKSFDFLAEDSHKLKENEEVDKDSEMQLHNMTTTNTNNPNNSKAEREEEQQQVGLVLLSSPHDNIDKQSEDVAKDSELVTTTTTTMSAITNNIINVEENLDKSETDKSQQKVEPFESEKIPEKEETNNDSCIANVQISDSSIVVSKHSSSSETDNNDYKLPTSSDIKSSVNANDASEPLPSLIDLKECGDCKENYNNELNKDDAGGNDDECTEPYDDELLVQFLDEANEIAEARLAARRHARAEAREIRMRELERQQKEQESNADRVFDMHSTVTGITPLSHMRLGLGSSPVTGLLNSTRGNSMSSRRSSEDSLEEEGRSLRDIRHELKDVEERFRKAMIANAQLDNDRASQTYQIQLLKDKLEDMEESYSQLQRECKEKTRDCNALKRSLDKLSEELKLVQGQLNERDTLIAEQGLVIVAIENEDGTDAKRALVTVENAQLLGSVQGSLDVRLKKFNEEKHQLQSEVQQLQEQLESYKSQGKGRGKGNSSNGPLGSDDDDYEAQREANKIIMDYKYKLQKAEQEIASLQSSLARSETQVIRYKSTAEAAEKAEAELKIERRKLQRENREAMEKLEELETSNNHLLKRLDKLKNAKSALLKDL